ncbi:DegQ family serine endoprotease [Ectothiorhodospiraceae bacterium 2226]|nr:DegQ family serine endoprotease [Ectothiorhodospiraceae bacterium 2226]
MTTILRVWFVAAVFAASSAVHAALPAADSQGQPLPTLAPLLEEITPAVVNISTRGRVQVQQSPLFNDPFFRHFFGDPPRQPRERTVTSLGSGVIVDAENGYVLTNAHVVQRADEININLRDGRNLSAQIVGTDPESDVAVLKVEPRELTQLPMGDSDALRVGDFVIAIGNPFGLGQTVTSGIVSALSRSGLGADQFEDFIQTDASINPGNSGGALVNLRGEVIGINTAILAPAGGNIGIGFAIPINMARDIMEQLVEHGEVRRGRLGVQAQDLTPELAQAFDLQQRQGAVIANVMPDSPAAQAGLQPGDVVLQVNGQAIRDATHLRNVVGLLRVGQEIELRILRNGQPRTLKTVIAERQTAQADGARLHARLRGATFANLSAEEHRGAAVNGGVRVAALEAGSPAHRNGLREGDIIVSVNRQPVRDVQALRDLAADAPQLLLNIRRGGGALFLLIR